MGEDKSIGLWISVLHRLGQMNLDKQLKEDNLSSGQFCFLVSLFAQDGISQEQLANYLCMDKGTTARAVKKLEAAGYVMRKTCPQDKRINRIFLKEKAYKMKDRLTMISRDWTDQLTKGFTPQEKEIVFKVLEEMAVNATDFLAKG